jgi:hypothetical protein
MPLDENYHKDLGATQNGGGSTMLKTILGKVHGKTIELEEDLGVAEGQQVEIQVKIVQTPGTWGEGIMRSAGGWADHPELDAIMEEIQRNRRLERRPQMEGE